MAKEKLTKEQKAQQRAEKKAAKKAAGKGLFREFAAFMSRGNALDLAVGVVIGSAFSAIVTAVSNILLAVCTWGIPGGISGLVTILPAANDAQTGVAYAGQAFSASSLNDVVNEFQAAQAAAGADLDFYQAQTTLLSQYTLHGGTYVYNGAAVIDWGTLINAIIAFLIIGLTLFIIVKAASAVRNARQKFEAERLERYYEKHPEERPVEPEPEAPTPTTEELLTKILAELKASNKSNKTKDE